MQAFKLASYAMAGLLILAGCAYAAYSLSPWPSVWMIRYAFAKDAADRNRKLDALDPAGVLAHADIAYDTGRRNRIDIYLPPRRANDAENLPAVMWIHGGAFVAGDKSDIEGYVRFLAAEGYAIATVGYSRAPESQYPTPVVEAAKALDFLRDNAQRFGIDANAIVLAGDSAGAQIASQLAAAIADKDYADDIGLTSRADPAAVRGIVLFCGVYGMEGIDLTGAFAGFLRTVMWSYFGEKNPTNDPRLRQFSVRNHITPDFPPVFISVGNADPLAPQSLALAETLKGKGVRTTAVFFPQSHTPPLQHEYQFQLDTEAGRYAFGELKAFLKRVFP
jgi:acetyl esterase/lipase